MILTKRFIFIIVFIVILIVLLLLISKVVFSNAPTLANDNNRYPAFSCSYERDHNPPISEESEYYYQQARALEKQGSYQPASQWRSIEQNYLKAIELNNWKAMNNLAILYIKGKASQEDLSNDNALNNNPTGIKRNRKAALDLYAQMVKLKVPQGYYNWHIAIKRGWVTKPAANDSNLALIEAARLGSPLAQVAIGNHYAYGLGRGKQRDDLAEQYFSCAGAQDNPQALIEVAQFYKIAKKNMPKALYFYQKASSLGSEEAIRYLKEAFSENPSGLYDFGYQADPELAKKYTELYYQLRKDPDLRFPNLMQDYPLPRHPTQGYDADHPDTRPE